MKRAVVVLVLSLGACGGGDGLPTGDYVLDSIATCDLGDGMGGSLGSLDLDGTIEFQMPAGTEVDDCRSVLRMQTGGTSCELCIVGEPMGNTWDLGPRYATGTVDLPSCRMAASSVGRHLDGQELYESSFRTLADGAIAFDYYFSGELRDTPGAAPETVSVACHIRAVPDAP